VGGHRRRGVPGWTGVGRARVGRTTGAPSPARTHVRGTRVRGGAAGGGAPPRTPFVGRRRRATLSRRRRRESAVRAGARGVAAGAARASRRTHGCDAPRAG